HDHALGAIPGVRGVGSHAMLQQAHLAVMQTQAQRRRLGLEILAMDPLRLRGLSRDKQQSQTYGQQPLSHGQDSSYSIVPQPAYIKPKLLANGVSLRDTMG